MKSLGPIDFYTVLPCFEAAGFANELWLLRALAKELVTSYN